MHARSALQMVKSAGARLPGCFGENYPRLCRSHSVTQKQKEFSPPFYQLALAERALDFGGDAVRGRRTKRMEAFRYTILDPAYLVTLSPSWKSVYFVAFPFARLTGYFSAFAFILASIACSRSISSLSHRRTR